VNTTHTDKEKGDQSSSEDKGPRYQEVANHANVNIKKRNHKIRPIPLPAIADPPATARRSPSGWESPRQFGPKTTPKKKTKTQKKSLPKGKNSMISAKDDGKGKVLRGETEK